MEKEKSLEEVKGKVSICNLCGRINVCDEDKVQHSNLKYDEVIDVTGNYRNIEGLYKQIGIQILAYERGYRLTKPR